MSRLAPLEVNNVPDLQESFDIIKKTIGYVPSSMLIMARRPEYVKALSIFGLAIAGPGEVEQGLKYLIAEVASKAAGCQYCVAHTAHNAHKFGVSQEKLDAVWLFESSDLFTAAEKAALCVARNAAQVPNMVTDEDFDALKKHYSDSQIVEIVGVIALFGFFNRWNDTFATPLEDEPKEFAEATLSKYDWSVGKHVK